MPLRVLSYNVHGLQGRPRRARRRGPRRSSPDVVIVQEAPRRFRWRHKMRRAGRPASGMVVAGGGLPSLGNLLLTTLRVRVHDTWCLRYPLTPGPAMRGAAFARCAVRGARFVVAGSHLATDPAERPGAGGRVAGGDWPRRDEPGDRRPATSTRAPAAAPGAPSPTGWSTPPWPPTARTAHVPGAAPRRRIDARLRRPAASTCRLRRGRHRPGPPGQRPPPGRWSTWLLTPSLAHWTRGAGSREDRVLAAVEGDVPLWSSTPRPDGDHPLARRAPGLRPGRHGLRDRRRRQRPRRDQEPARARVRRRLLRAGDRRRRRLELAARPQPGLRQHAPDLVEAVHPVPRLPDAGRLAGLPAPQPAAVLPGALRRPLRPARAHLVRHRGGHGRAGRGTTAGT